MTVLVIFSRTRSLIPRSIPALTISKILKSTATDLQISFDFSYNVELVNVWEIIQNIHNSRCTRKFLSQSMYSKASEPCLNTVRNLIRAKRGKITSHRLEIIHARVDGMPSQFIIVNSSSSSSSSFRPIKLFSNLCRCFVPEVELKRQRGSHSFVMKNWRCRYSCNRSNVNHYLLDSINDVPCPIEDSQRILLTLCFDFWGFIGGVFIKTPTEGVICAINTVLEVYTIEDRLTITFAL